MQKKGEKESKNNIVNLNRATESKERIVQAVNYLKEKFKQLPQKIGELKEMLLNAISELFSTRPSDKTLHKYKDLWHQKEIEEKATEGTSSQSLELDKNSPINTDEIITIPCELEIVLEPTLEVSISNEVENILCEENTNLETPPTLISTDLDTPSNSQEHNIQQIKPIPHNGFRICHTHPNVALRKKDEVKAVESISDNGFKKSATPPPLYEGLLLLIKSWFNQKTVLSYQGVAMSGLAKASSEKRETLKSISPNQKVVITDYTHSSFLVNPDNRENILVYVTPVSEINNWNIGIAVKAIYLFPLDEI
jgi:regulator of replication initiation timing